MWTCVSNKVKKCSQWGSHRCHAKTKDVLENWEIRLTVASSEKVKVAQSCLTLCDPMDYTAHGILQATTGHNTGVGSLSLLQGIFSTQGLNPALPHCRQILYQLSHKQSPRILEWAAYPFSSRSSQPKNWTRVSCVAGVTLSYFFKKHLLIINYVSGECSIQHIILNEKHYKPNVTIIY